MRRRYQVPEERVVDPVTGGAKGQKDERFSLIPVFPRSEVARVYGYGCKKYAPNNWRKGYRWSLSLDALYRHISKFEWGQSLDVDPCKRHSDSGEGWQPDCEFLECGSGLHHLAHAQFHLNTLMEFERLGLGTDDREDSSDR